MCGMTDFFRMETLELSRWFKQTKRRPLVIRGARQVGKSTLVRAFAKTQPCELREINLEQHRHLETTFATLSPTLIMAELEATLGTSINDTRTLLFLDEIQATPSALAALRCLFEARPRLPIVAAGSLLEFVLREHQFSMPVGRIEYLFLGPMRFSEFLHARGEAWAVEQLRSLAPDQPHKSTSSKLSSALHQRLISLQREFLFIGGMPEAISEYVRTQSFLQTQRIHRNIVETYRDDFAKYARASALVRLQKVYNYIPSAVGQKLKYSRISRDDRAREVREAIELLSLARVIAQVHHSDCSGLPLGAGVDPHTYKCLFLDVGLMQSMLGLNFAMIAKQDTDRLVNEGGLAEQFIGQHLYYRVAHARSPELYHWLREGKTGNAEVDYVSAQRGSIVPIEVKAGSSGRLKSLFEFVRDKKPPCAVRFDLNAPSLQRVSHDTLQNGKKTKVSFPLLSLPLYMVDELDRLLNNVT